MNYATAMNSIDTAKALNFLEIEATPNGSYLKFPCPKCQKEAVIKTHGEKKNVWFFPECRGSGHIISLAMAARKLEWDILNFRQTPGQGSAEQGAALNRP